MEKTVDILSEVFQDILSIDYGSDRTFKQQMDDFYEVVRKWGIKQGNWTKNGSRICNTYWLMVKNQKIMKRKR